MTDDSTKKKTPSRPDKRRDHGDTTPSRRRRSNTETVEAGSGNSQVSGSGIRQGKSQPGATGVKGFGTVVEPGAGQDSGISYGRHRRSRSPLKISYVAKKRLLMILDAIVVVGILVAVVLLFSLISRNNDLSATAARLERENQQITMDNRKISQENQTHIDCIAQVFAKYTRDQKPVTIQDLNTCKTTSSDVAGNLITSNSGELKKPTTPSNSRSSTNLSNPSSTGKSTPNKPAQAKQPPVQKTPAERIINFVKGLL